MPEADNEILVTVNMFYDHYLRVDGLNETFRLFDIYDDKYLDQYWDSINLYDYIGSEYTVVGIVDDSDYYNRSGYYRVDCYIREELFEKLLNERKNYYDMDYYVISDDDMENDISSLMSGGYLIDVCRIRIDFKSKKCEEDELELLL